MTVRESASSSVTRSMSRSRPIVLVAGVGTGARTGRSRRRQRDRQPLRLLTQGQRSLAQLFPELLLPELLHHLELAQRGATVAPGDVLLHELEVGDLVERVHWR